MVSSLANKIIKLKNKSDFKIDILARVRGVVDCKDCLKPRCIYFLSPLSHMKPPLSPTIEGSTDGIALTTSNYRTMARDRLRDAMESAIFVCDMAPLDPDDPFYNIFLCDPALDCNTYIEVHFYTSKVQPNRVEMCCHCTGEFDSPIELNSFLKAPDGPYSVVLHVCKKMP